MDIRELGKFTLLNHVGKGSVATVFRATDNETGAVVAIKVFRATPERPVDFVRRLRDREVRMLIRIQHPNVVKYYESGQAEDSFYYTMEFVENSLLTRMRKVDEFALEDKVNILRQTINALQAIHHQGVVHRDIKPGNILLDQDPNGAIQVKVTDLGIAKHVSETDVIRQTASRRVPGTPKYLSPEQILLKPVDGRADIFSLGVVAYELLSGRPPFKGQDSQQYVKANLHQEPRALHHVRPDLEPFLGQLVDRMLAKDREERYDSDTLVRDLDLTYQHLVSGAALVEETNPASAFYVPPAFEPKAEAPRPVALLAPWAWASAAALVAAGVVVWAWLWPGPALQHGASRPIDLSRPPVVAPRQALEKGEPWRAFALLQGVSRNGLSDEEAQQLAELSGALHADLARPSRETAMEMMAEGRLAEAKIVLEQMRALFPGAPQTQQLARAIEDHDSQAARQRKWQRAVDGVGARLARGEFPEAIGQAEELIGEFSSDGEKVTRLQTLIVKGLNSWADALLRPETAPGAIEQYLGVVSRYRDERWAAHGLRDRSAEFCLRLGRHYEQVRFFSEATRCYNAAAALGDPQRAREASERLAQMRRSIELQPVAIGVLQRALEKEGFRSQIWTAESAEGGRQSVSDGVLLIEQNGAVGERVSLRETAPTIRNVGDFTASVRFRMRQSGRRPARRCEAGLEVQDRTGNSITLYFDGARYNLSRSKQRGGRVIQGGGSVSDGFGDEDRTWHEIALRYIYDTERVVALLDGQEVDDYTVRLGDFYVRVFARVTGGGACRAEFKEFRCGP